MSGRQSLAVGKGGRRPCTILVDRLNGLLRERADVARRRGVSTDDHSSFDQTKEGENIVKKIHYNQPHLTTVEEEYPSPRGATATVSTVKM